MLFPVLQKHWQECHRREVAPMSLLTYTEAPPRADMNPADLVRVKKPVTADAAV